MQTSFSYISLKYFSQGSFKSEQVLRKRRAIFYHQSQNNSVMFQGDDEREFWQRVEERNREIAITYNALGMADYQAMETFRRYHF